MNNEERAKKQKPVEGLKPLSGILDVMQGALFGDFEIEAETQTAPLTKTSTRLSRAEALVLARPDDTENAFLAPELVQCLLPHSNPKDATIWAYRNGNYSLVIQSGINHKTMQPFGLPWGSISKVLLVWIATEAVLQQQRNLRLKSKSFNDFMRLLKFDPATGGGKRGDAARLKDHMNRLFNAIISIEIEHGDEKEGDSSRKNMFVTDEQNQWWNFKSPEQGSLFDSEIVLGEKFFKALIDNPVPFDIKAVAGLIRSPLAIDLYIWLKYRRFTMGKKGRRELKIPVERIWEQFGAEYKRLDNFRAALKRTLPKVKKVYLDLDYDLDTQFLTIYNKAALSAEAKAAAQKRLKDENPMDRVSEKAKDDFKRDFPKWDAEAVIADFYSWRTDKQEVSINTDRHFKKFAETWVEKNR